MTAIRVVLINLLILIILLGVVACGIEVWARTQPRNSFLEFDPLLGFRLSPGATGVYRGLSMLSPNPNIRTAVHVNSLGLRGQERDFARDAPSRRLLVLGDSFVQAFEVPYAETFYAQLEAKAAHAGGRELEAIPMGVMGYGQAQQLLWLRDTGVRFQPDMVLTLLFLTNDIRDNASDLHFSAGRPYFELHDEGLRLASLPAESVRYKYMAAEYLRSYRIYKELAGRLPLLADLMGQLGLRNNPTADARRSLSAKQGPRDARRAAVLRRSWELTFALLQEQRRVTEAIGSPLILAYHGSFPTGTDQSDAELVESFCARTQLQCLNLNPALESDKANFVPRDRHWSEAGHRRVAEQLWERWIANPTPATVSDTTSTPPPN